MRSPGIGYSLEAIGYYRGYEMDYQEHTAATDRAFEGILASTSDWNALCGKIEIAMKVIGGVEASLAQELQDLRASFAAEQSFFKTLNGAADKYRELLDGFKAFYQPPEPVVEPAIQKTGRSGWFGGRKDERPAPDPKPARDEEAVYRGQRAFAEAKRRAAEYDAHLEGIRGEIEKAIRETEEVAYGLRASVVDINATLRDSASRKLETRRFQLEDAVAACSERVTSLGLNARVVARLTSGEFVENPFVGEDALV